MAIMILSACDNPLVDSSPDGGGGGQSEIGEPPEPPSSLSAQLSGSDLQLLWDDVSSVNDTYQLQWRPYGSDAWQTLAQTGASATSYTHAGAATAGNEYRIRATNEFGPAGSEEGWVEYPVVSISPMPGEYSTGFDLVMEGSTDASIYYTTNGADPDATATLYTAPVTYDVPQTFTVRAIAIDASGNSGPIAQAEYTAVLTVTTANATGPGSLTQMLAAAGEGAVVTFDNSYTITAPASLADPPSWFTIGSSVTIDAAGHDIILDANLAGRHFLVETPATLTLRSDPGAGGSLLLRNGRGADGGSSVRGGSIRVDNSAALVAEHVEFRDNRTLDGAPSKTNGGAIFMAGEATITGGAFTNNISDSWGGAIAVDQGASGDLVVTGTTFTGNIAGEGVGGSSVGGGAINLAAGTTAVVRDAHFEENEGNGGGAIRSAGTLTVSGSTFLRNSASSQGGAIEAGMQGSTAKITGSEFYANSTGGLGGAIASSFSGAPSPYGRVVVSSSVFVGNLVPVGSQQAGVVMRSENHDTVANSTMYNNGHGSGYVAFSKAYLRPLEVFNSVLAINPWGSVSDRQANTNTWVNPVRTPDPGDDGNWGTSDDDFGDLRLQDGSNAIGAGNNNLVRWDFADLDEDGDTTEPEPFDLDGNPRMIGDAVDQGAYEYQ